MRNTTNVLTKAGLITALAIGGFSAAPARAAEAETPRFEAVEQFMTEKLNAVQELSAEQRDKVRAAVREQLPALKKTVTKFAEQQRALREMLADLNVEEKTIRAEAAKLADALVDYAKQRAQLVSKLKELLEVTDRPEAIERLTRFVDEIARQLGRE